MARLTTKSRASMPKKDFALPGEVKKGPQGGRQTHGAYPIPDASHARDALSRVSANGTPAEKTEVRRKVEAKFPGIQVSGAKKDDKKGGKKK